MPDSARAERALTTLRAARAALDQEIGHGIRSDPALTEACRLLTSAPGMGLIVATTLLAGLPELGRLDRRQVASLAGLAPPAWSRPQPAQPKPALSAPPACATSSPAP